MNINKNILKKSRFYGGISKKVKWFMNKKAIDQSTMIQQLSSIIKT